MEAERLAVPLIRTKLHRPPVTEQLVCRKRLHERMDLGLKTPLTVVAAPAGYGKSVLASHWSEEQERSCAWLSLNTSESDLRLFSDYLLAAVKTCFPEACAQSETVVRSPNPIVIHTLGACLLNDLDEIDENFVLVLDDYHRIERGSAVHDLLSFLLEHPPANLTLVITTRHDPPFPMASLRAKNLVTEIRLDDLRFSNPETDEMLEKAAGMTVSDRASANLERQLEGWAAGLHLVSLAVRNTKDPDAFLESLHGGLPHTQDFLLQEVLNTQPPELRDCLSRSSIFDRFCAQVFEEVCLSDRPPEDPGLNGHEFMALLQQSHLFTIPLDVEGEWFRYHHLFRELLQRQLHQVLDDGEINKLHLRARDWFEGRGLIEEAIGHALAGDDPVSAAEIVEQHRHAEVNQDRWHVVSRWLGLLPPAIIERRPLLLLARAWERFNEFRLLEVPPLLERARSLVADEPMDESLLGELDFHRGYLALWLEGNAESATKHLESARDRLPESYVELVAETEFDLAIARHMAGQGKAAVTALEERIQKTTSPDTMMLSRLVGGQAFIHLLSGDLASAERASQRLRAVAEDNDNAHLLAWGDHLIGLARLHSYRLTDALDCFLSSAELRHICHVGAAVDTQAGLVLTLQALQRTDDAEEEMAQLMEFARGTTDQRHLTVAESCQARLALLRGDLETADRWARSFDEDANAASALFWLQVPLLTKARTQVAVGSPANLECAFASLDELERQAADLHFTCRTIETMALRAVILEKQGRDKEALTTLEQLITDAASGGWIRPFVEAGPVMAQMLGRLDLEGDDQIFVRRVLAAFEPADAAAPTELTPPLAAEPVAAARRETPISSGRPALDALTDRELDILELLQERLYNKEIAAKLHISTHTVNYHLKHIYQKLAVNSRRQAVRCGLEKGILKPA